jgi:allantoinase
MKHSSQFQHVTPIDLPDYPRDLKGYGDNPPKANWKNGAKIAVQFVLNLEEGAENAVMHGDAGSEMFLSDILGTQIFPNRHRTRKGR